MKASPKTQSNRRQFLATAAAALPAVCLAGHPARALARALADGPVAAGQPAVKPRPIGLELYSVRGELSRDLPKTLTTVAKMGYEVVEFYSPYYGWNFKQAKEIRTQLDDLGMRCRSTHNSYQSFTPEGVAKAIELNQIIGAKYLVLAGAPGGTNGAEGWKRLAGRLATVSGELAGHGLAAGFHNHQSEWAKVDGDLRIMDVLAANTPPEFVLQFDIGTAVEVGADPVAWIKANPGRIKCAHLKDWAPGEAKDEKGFRVLFGEGATPWREVIAALEATGGVEFYLLEQEGSRFSEFETAQRCLANWKAFRAQG